MNFLTADLAQAGERQHARGVGFEIPLEGSRSLRPAKDATNQIVIGIRPERLTLEAHADHVQLGGSVAMREVLGAEVVLHIDSPSGALTVRTGASAAPKVGDLVKVWLDPKAIHVFDHGSEARL
ncbi:MAG: TOBE domain-containing protein [Proteobacteria bacterium]|nr:TOBE domain-containing protein [Pseudomonadota bacterium]